MAFNLNSINKSAKNNGAWFDYEGSSFLIASTSSFAFQNEFQALQKPHQRQIEKGTLPPETSTDLLCKALANTILLDWKNVEADGKPIGYTKDIAFKALKENDELRHFVQEVAMDISQFKAKQEAEDAKS